MKLFWFIALTVSYITILANETITNTQENDGFGSQFQNIIATVIFAELNNKNYVYTPFKKMEHNYDSDPLFIQKKEWLINFITNFKVNTNNTGKKQCGCKAFLDKNIIKGSQCLSLKKIKQVFRANKENPYINNKNLNIALHMRRPNNHDNRIMGADTPDDFFLKIINKLRGLYQSKKPLFHIYSQGNVNNFAKFNAPDISLHLNDTVEDAFIPMVFADILVIGRSSFSYTAGLLSEGIVYYIPFWHSPLPHWIDANKLVL